MRLFALLVLAMSACASSTTYQSFDDVTYNYESERTIWSRRAQINIRIAELGVRDSNNPPLILIHPWGFSMKIWQDIAPRLAEGQRVLLVDLPGHGKSDKLNTHYTMRRLAGAVLDAADAAGLDRFIVAGNSLGGATALAVAETKPDRVIAMILIASPGGRRLPDAMQNSARMLAKASSLETLSDEAWFIGLAAAKRSDSALAGALRDDFYALRRAAEWPAWCRATIRVLVAVAEYAPALETIAVPTLVVHGQADLLIGRGDSEALATRLPNAQLEVIEGCGHLPEVECTDRLGGILQRFLRGQKQGIGP